MSQQQPPQGAPQQPYGTPQQPYAAPQQPPYAAPQQPDAAQQPPYGAQQPYAQGYPVQPYYQPTAYAAARPTNVLAIIAICIVWVVSIGGIILGHIALSQIKRTGEGGRALALTAVIVGYVAVGLVIAFLVVYFVIIALVLGTVASTGGFNS